MDNYKYIVKNLDLSSRIKLHNYFSGRFGRKDLLKDFCAKNGIDYKPIKGHKYKLPEVFLIHHGELKYLGDIRDKVILANYERYLIIQKDNVREVQSLLGSIKNQKEIIEDHKERLTTRKRQLANVKDPLERIHLQSTVAELATSIANESDELTRLESNLNEHYSILNENTSNWIKQIEIINSAFAIRKEKFNRNISRKIIKELNFTHCISEFPDYSDSVKAILKGGYDEK